ncbi:MAG: TonB-dependent receptor [Bacteroidetes bacterium]|jgi:iron complex outermembrane receptor protein|nr:TonB-dependent receptor [Bacteroidota bacterium]
MTDKILIGLLSLLYLPLHGQSDSLVYGDLPEIELVRSRLPHPGRNALFSQNEELQLTLKASSTLAELLSAQTTSIIRDRGNNNLATMSVRGGSSQQTQVLWNGANINNGMLGLSDLSTISPLMIEHIELQPVQNDESYQPIGGALELSNTQIDSQDILLGILAGQFGFQQYNMSIANRWSTNTEIRLKGLYGANQQDFPYLEEHASVLLPERQPHAEQRQLSGMIEWVQKLSQKNTLEWRSWIHAMERKLPPSLQQRRSTAVQSDSFQRHQVIWRYEGNQYQHLFNYTHRREINHFEDPLNAQDSRNPFRAHQWISRHRLDLTQNILLSGGANIQYQIFDTENYEGRQEFADGELFLGTHFYPFGPRQQMEVQMRQGWRNDQLAPLSGQIAWAYIHHVHSLRLEYSTAYRFPSANDLFWEPFGNPDLKPEKSDQLQLQYTFKDAGFVWEKLRFATYYKKIEDWILWAPLNDNFFRPHNILEVTAAGIEASIQKSISWTPRSSTLMRLLYNYQYVRNTGPYDSPVAQKGENLIYMPEHQWAVYMSTTWRDISLLYQHEYQSKLFAQANLEMTLPPRHLAHLTLSYSINIRKHNIQCFLKVQNIWNESYVFQPQIPAPGRFWRWGLIFKPKF